MSITDDDVQALREWLGFEPVEIKRRLLALLDEREAMLKEIALLRGMLARTRK